MEKSPILEVVRINNKSISPFTGEKKYIATGDINENNIESFSVITYENRPSRANIEVKVGQVLFARMKETKKIIQIDKTNVDYIFSTGFCVLEPTELITSDYLRIFLNSDLFQNQKDKYSKGATQKAINNEGVGKIIIPLTNIDEQKKIVAVLDKAQDLIDARKEQIRLMDELIQAQFIEMFGDPVENSMKWPLHFLSELCKVGSSKRIYKNEQTISGIPFLRISDLMNRIEVGAETCDLFISSEKFEELKEKRLVPKVGEILVTSRGTLGECYIVNDDNNFYFQDGMISWLSNISDLVLPKYLLYLFKTQGIKRQIDEFQAGSTVAYLSITMLKQLEIMLPPIELQNQFISFIQQVDRLKIHAQKSLDEILGLFDSLIQSYFE